MKLRNLSWAVLVALGLSAPVSAQVYEMSYTDTNGSVVVKGPSISWHNPNSLVVVTTIAGLDRKVKLELLKGTTVIQTQTSGIINVANRIRASDNNEFYGVKFNLTKPADGNYILRSTVYSINNVQVSVNDYAFNVDTIAPDMGAISWGMNYGGGNAPDGIPRWSLTEAKFIKVAGLTDTHSGVGKVTYESRYLSGPKAGTVATSGDASYFPSSAEGQVGTGGQNSVTAAHFPGNVAEKMQFTFYGYDKAGNRSQKDQVFYAHTSCGEAPVAVAFEDPNYTGSYLGKSVFTGFRPLASGSVITKNPMKVIYRISKAQYRKLPEGAIYGGYPSGITDHGLKHTDDTYAYVMLEGTLGQDRVINWPNFGWTNGMTWRCHQLTVPGVTFSDGALPPKWKSTQPYIEGIGWVGTTAVSIDIPDLPLSATISRVRVSAEQRSYPQRLDSFGTSCTIPAGQTSCEMSVALPYNTANTVGVYHQRPELYNADAPEMRVSTSYNWQWDAQPPTVDDLVWHKTAEKEVKFTATDLSSGALWGRVKVTQGWLDIQQGGKSVRTYAAKSIEGQGDTVEITVSYAGLADGVYDIFGQVEDGFKNRARKLLFTYTNDSTPPNVTFKHKGGSVPASINNIKDLRVTVSDNLDPNATVTRMTLVGGPINDALDLGFSKLSDGWQPEVPRMFPTLDAGQEYTLSVSTADAQGNTATVNQVFSLSPQNMVRHEGITVFATSQSLLDSNDKPLGKISFKGALTDGGSQSRGPQAGYFTLRRDSAFAVMFNGTKVAPGETKDVVIPLDATGSVTLPVWPADTGVKGKASYMLDIPQLVVN